MILSLSVRAAENFHSKEKASMSLDALAGLAVRSGYSAMCMRASQVGVHSPKAAVEEAAAIIRGHGLRVTMVTGDFDIVYNNDAAPKSLRRIGPYLELALALGAPLVRVALKTDEDISWAQQAADEAAKYGVKLVHQCHTQSLFETVDGIERTLQRIGRANFGLVYEPANLELCGQDYGPETVRRLAPWIFNVYLQNQMLNSDGKWTLNTWCRGTVPFDLIPIHCEGGIDFFRIFEGLAAINYRGPVTVHQAQLGEETVEQTVKATARCLSAVATRSGFLKR